MKLKRRDFLKGLLPAIWGGKQVVEDLLRGPAEEPEPEVVVRVDTPTGVTASCYPAGDPDPRYAPVRDGPRIRLEVDELSGSPRWMRYIEDVGWRRML